MRNRKIEEEKFQDHTYLYFLKRWNSINPSIPRPGIFNIRGGGYFLVFNRKGVVIDPGFDFMENLYSQGFSIADIDAVIVTHDHPDHIDNLDTIISLSYTRNKLLKKPQRIDFFLNQGASSRYSFLMKLGSKSTSYYYQLFTLSLSDKKKEIFPGFDVCVKKADHAELSSDTYAIGLICTLTFPQSEQKELRIGITGDTKYNSAPGYIDDDYMDCDIIIAHLNNTPLKELKTYTNLGIDDKGLLAVINDLEKKEEFMEFYKHLTLSFNYDSIEDILNAEKIKPEELPVNLKTEHLCLHGILNIFTRFANNPKNSHKQKLMIVAELGEEMGSYKNKISQFINSEYPKSNLKCLTADIGMVIRCKPDIGNMPHRIEIKCSKCELNNDYIENDIFHFPENIKEVCLKNEDEGLVYFCKRHDPESINNELLERGFTQRIDRYNLFKNIIIN